MKRIHGKAAVVPGAGLSIGCASALRLAAEGANVVVTDIVAEAGRETIETIPFVAVSNSRHNRNTLWK